MGRRERGFRRSKEGHTASEGGLDEFWAELNAKDLDRLRAALKEAGNEASNALRSDLKKAGQIIQLHIQDITPVYKGKAYSSGRGARRATVELRSASGATKTYKGTHTPGLLKRSTRLKTTTRFDVRVFNNAKAVSRRWPGGYRYGKRLEFDPRYGGKWAFFYKGYDEVRDRAYAVFNDVLNRAFRAYVK